ncbi:hypothetical protein ASE01_22165 [Nocardioides sp. Root190]|uniref:DUF1800 domain-containing protein n=1 Tax=Nocardioides sp. Root190 TaxID=1736488 RepID=UPI0006F7E8D3|nr:DUF1800 domain-containing protein [Nocardioides sp. Root190]KRB72753.1 hypothetical protein ASE01_22165 [Nocardioides sp. Root190]
MGAASRRALVALPAVGAVAVSAGVASPAEAAVYLPRAWTRTAIPTAATLHQLKRFTSGYTPALNKQVIAAGGFTKWFEKQLGGSYSDGWSSDTSRWWTSINASASEIWRRDQEGIEGMWLADANYERWTLVRRLGSQRQVLETMTDFWENHLHVPAKGEVGPFRSSYGKTIRRFALGRYDDMLAAAITHPAMAVYLGNANSSKVAPNENLGRELLELHTVGRGNFDEDDVKTSARILTGYRIDSWRTWTFSYDPAHHWTGPVGVLGFSHANAAPDGRAVLTAYLRHLARHPATARRIAFKLARRFVSDTPTDALVARLAKVYLASNTDIRPVLRSLVTSTEFRGAYGTGKKVRNPTEDVVATWRSLGATITAAPRDGEAEVAANEILWQTSSLGLRPFSWQPPDGRPDTAAAWSSTSRFLNSLDLHYTMSGGWWPQVGVRFRTARSWLPADRIRFDQLVDHLARTIHGRGSTSLLLQAACEATGCTPATSITANHQVVKYEMARLLTVFLDCPTHMTR